MKELLLYLFTFIISFLFYYIFVYKRKKILNKFKDGKELTYLKIKYGIKVTDKNLASITKEIIFVNSFILSTVVFVVSLFDNFIIGLLIGFIPLIILILVCYDIIGKRFKGGK